MIQIAPQWIGEAIGWLLFLSTLITDVITDVKLSEQRRSNSTAKGVNHFRGAALRVPGLIGAMLFFGWKGIGVCFAYWFLFDALFGYYMTGNIGYLGITSKLDKLQHKYEIIVWIKFIGGIAGIAWYFIKLF